MRYHLLLNTFGRMVKIKKTYFPYSEGAYIFFHDCTAPHFKDLQITLILLNRMAFQPFWLDLTVRDVKMT